MVLPKHDKSEKSPLFGFNFLERKGFLFDILYLKYLKLVEIHALIGFSKIYYIFFYFLRGIFVLHFVKYILYETV